MAAKWIGGVVAVVAVLSLAGQCAGDDAPDVPSGAAQPTPTAAPIQPAFAAAVPTTVAPTTTATTAPTSRPAPTTRRPTPTTTPAPQPAPRPQPRPQPQPQPAAAASEDDEDDSGDGSVYYKNCTAVRNAGADPVRRGGPGYGSHLDRDGDGVGCE